jgi:hypothetical protein
MGEYGVSYHFINVNCLVTQFITRWDMNEESLKTVIHTWCFSIMWIVSTALPMFELSCCRGFCFLLDWGTGSSGNRVRSLILAISSSSWAETWSRNCVQTNRNCWNVKYKLSYILFYVLPTSFSQLTPKRNLHNTIRIYFISAESHKQSPVPALSSLVAVLHYLTKPSCSRSPSRAFMI